MTKTPKPAPRPGRRARGSTTGRPIMVLLDLLGRRWVLRILWELRGSPLTFRALQAACGGLSPSVLNSRLSELRDTGIVEQRIDEGYALTEQGRELLSQLAPLTAWSEKWARSLA
ncbi:helix-turn-helix domain-containing protein [uncultured Parvibaculum sp.]|uniref:winged helix-turn-helix transcriptional regulator n=1 Tax=uncultured Parvibaculum sp. TaxID=291828 RepID=UPI0030D7C88D|tara:strand:+ start:41711 stop:42055 length:345 start_codon:yes stop_codon:yes gene_type:complete